MKVKDLFEEKEIASYKLVTKALPKIAADCKYFLSESNGLPMMRGSFGSSDKAFEKKTIRTDRKPRSSGHDPFFNWAHDTYFKETFDINNIRSSSLFVTGSPGTARYYGDLVFVFPIGEFDYFWSPNINDSYEDISFLSTWSRDAGLDRDWVSRVAYPFFEKLIADNDFSFSSLDKSKDSNIREMKKYLIDEFNKDYKYQKNTNLNKALKTGHEILITAPANYYSISGRALYEAMDGKTYEDEKDVYKKFLDLMENTK